MMNQTKPRVRKRCSGWVIFTAASWAATAIKPATAQAPLGPAESDSAITLQGKSSFVLLDLTSKDSKTNPFLRIGYQSEAMSEAVKKQRAKNPVSALHHLLTYSIDLRAAPSGSRGSLFADGRAAVGSQVNISIGQAYLASYVPARDQSVLAANLTLVARDVDIIKAAKEAARLAQINGDATQVSAQNGTVEDARNRIAGGTLRDGTVVPGFLPTLEAAQKRATNAAVRGLVTAAIDYAGAAVAFANDTTGTLTPPEEPQAEVQTSNPLYDAWYLRGSYRRRGATFFDPSRPFAEQFSSNTFESGGVQAGYSANYKRLAFVKFPVTVGLSGGWGHSDNLDALPTIEATDTTVIPSADGMTERTLTEKNSGLLGTYKRSSVGLMNVDVLLYPDLANASKDGKNPRSSIALDLFGRFKGGAEAVYGAGLYLTEPGAPTRVYGGLNIYRSARKQLAIDIVAGFPF
ncbi:MAG: hypothetical protein V4671_01270 [Armatimonadota bacterium]